MITYREARKSDNSGLLELTKASGMAGVIGLRTERDPDFFQLMELRGPSTVYIALHRSRIVGSICVSHFTVYVDRESRSLYYISDFKVHPEFRRQGIGLELTCRVVEFLDAEDADLALLHVARGNNRPFVFFSDRKDYPDFENIGTFCVYQFPASRKGVPTSDPIFEVPADEEALGFLNDYYRSRQLARQILHTDIRDSHILAYRQEGKIIGLICLTDTSLEKRHIIHKMPVLFRWLIRVINSLRFLNHNARLPLPGQPIRMLYIRYLAVPEPSLPIMRALFRRIKREAYARGFSFLSLGLHEKDPLTRFIPGRFPIVFKSTGMLVSMKRNREQMDRVHSGIPYCDFTCV